MACVALCRFEDVKNGVAVRGLGESYLFFDVWYCHSLDDVVDVLICSEFLFDSKAVIGREGALDVVKELFVYGLLVVDDLGV